MIIAMATGIVTCRAETMLIVSKSFQVAFRVIVVTMTTKVKHTDAAVGERIRRLLEDVQKILIKFDFDLFYFCIRHYAHLSLLRC